MKRKRDANGAFIGNGKQCYTCAHAVKEGYFYVGADAEVCPKCGGHAFFWGHRIPKTLWPELPDHGPDTLDEDGEEIPGAWEANFRR